MEYWKRPGKDEEGHSASLHYKAPGIFHVFSTDAAPLEADRAVDLFGAKARLEHGGDFKECTRALRLEGYGSPIPETVLVGSSKLGGKQARSEHYEPAPLAAVMETFHRWLFLPDDGHIKVTLGAYAANRMDGDPVWLMLVGGSSSGKTEALASLGLLPHIHAQSSLSGEAALLSGTAKKEKAASATGGILNAIGAFGILALKDFTSILSMKFEKRAELLAALREVYDGSWSRSVGVDGGRTLSWEGKIGIIAGCTPIIDSHHAVIGAMGERFVFYRIPIADAEKQAERALQLDGKTDKMREELAKAVADLFAGVDLQTQPLDLAPEERKRLTGLAVLAVRCRSAVERDGRTREVILIPDPEAPARMVGILSRLLRGMVAVGVDREEAWRLLVRVAVGSMPALRWSAFLFAAQADTRKAITTTEFATEMRHPTVTVRRSLEDLNAHDILIRVKSGATTNAPDLWQLSDWARSHFEALKSYIITPAS